MFFNQSYNVQLMYLNNIQLFIFIFSIMNVSNYNIAFITNYCIIPVNKLQTKGYPIDGMYKIEIAKSMQCLAYLVKYQTQEF